MPNNNLKELRKRLGFTQYDVARLTGFSQPFVYNAEAGLRTLNLPQQQKFAEVLNVSVDEIYGEIKTPAGQNPDSVTIDIISATPCCGSGSFEDSESFVVGKWVMPVRDFKDITFASPCDVKQMRVIGDSMEPTVKDGDYILVDVSHNAFDVDGVYLIRMANGMAVKRLQAGLTGIKILSDNKKYEPLTADVGEVYIIGKVIKIMNLTNV